MYNQILLIKAGGKHASSAKYSHYFKEHADLLSCDFSSLLLETLGQAFGFCLQDYIDHCKSTDQDSLLPDLQDRNKDILIFMQIF